MIEIDMIREQALDHFYGRNGSKVSYEKAYQMLSQIKDDQWSQYIIGFMLDNALYLKQDKKKAMELYLKSAEQGNSEAQYMIGHKLRFELKNGWPGEASEYFIRSAEQGNPRALCALGLENLTDPKKAVEYFEKAAGLNYADAYNYLSMMYVSGINSDGVTDKGKAEEYFTKALELFTESAENGGALMQYRLGIIYSNKDIPLFDPKKAICWYERSAENYGQALCALADLYESGDIVVKDLNKAFEYRSKAAEMKIGEAIHGLGRMYENGIGVDRDIEAAKRCYEKAIDAGHIPEKNYSHVVWCLFVIDF